MKTAVAFLLWISVFALWSQQSISGEVSIGLEVVEVQDAKPRLENKDSPMIKLMPKAGLIVITVDEGSSFADGGVLPGDVITTIDGQFVGNLEKLTEWKKGVKVGDTVRISVSRYDENRRKWNKETLPTILKAAPPDQPKKGMATINKAGPRQAESLFTADVENGMLGISFDAPVYYIPANREMVYYRTILHAYKSGGDCERDQEGFYKVSGKAEEIKFSSSDPSICEVSRVPSLGLGQDLQIKKTGECRIKVELAGKQFEIPLSVTKLDFAIDEEAADVIRKHGLPDSDKQVYVSWPETKSIDNVTYNPSAYQRIISAKHWRYNKFPHLVVSVVNGRVHAVSSDDPNATSDFVNWMSRK